MLHMVDVHSTSHLREVETFGRALYRRRVTSPLEVPMTAWGGRTAARSGRGGTGRGGAGRAGRGGPERGVAGRGGAGGAGRVRDWPTSHDYLVESQLHADAGIVTNSTAWWSLQGRRWERQQDPIFHSLLMWIGTLLVYRAIPIF